MEQYRPLHRDFPLYNCTFLDILGYKQKAIDYFDQRLNLLRRIERALSSVTTAMALTAPVLDTSNLTIEIISDSIIMFQPATGPSLGAMLPFTCQFASTLSYEGLLVRGGISRGRHHRCRTKYDFDFLASEALQNAHLLESKKAKNPRILVDSALVEHLPLGEKDLVIREGNKFIVDFAHHVINREGRNFGDVHAEMADLQDDMRRQSCRKIKRKIQWILDYYYWTIHSNPKWDATAFRRFASRTNRRFVRLRT